MKPRRIRQSALSLRKRLAAFARTWICRDLMAAIVLSVIVSPLHAADEAKKVLSTTTIDLGDRSVIYQRVEPPMVTVPVVVQQTVTSTRTAAETAALMAQARRVVQVTLSLSCTVHDSGVTEVRWSHEGAEYRALSSIDFNTARGVSGFEVDGKRYTVFMGVGRAMSQSTLARLQASGTKLPASMAQPAPALPASVMADIAQNGGSRYVVLSAPEQADAAAFAGMDALHTYFDAHKADIVAAWNQSEAERVAHEQWLKDHPPVPQDTVIQFWPKKGSRYLGTTASDAAAATSGKEGQ